MSSILRIQITSSTLKRSENLVTCERVPKLHGSRSRNIVEYGSYRRYLRVTHTTWLTCTRTRKCWICLVRLWSHSKLIQPRNLSIEALRHWGIGQLVFNLDEALLHRCATSHWQENWLSQRMVLRTKRLGHRACGQGKNTDVWLAAIPSAHERVSGAPESKAARQQVRIPNHSVVYRKWYLETSTHSLLLWIIASLVGQYSVDQESMHRTPRLF